MNKIEWHVSHVQDPEFSKFMKKVCPIGIEAFTSVEVQFLKSNTDKEFHDSYCKPLEKIFKKGPKTNDWKIFKKALKSKNWNIVEEKMRLIIEELYLMDYSNFGINDIYYLVTSKDKSNKLNGFAIFYITPEYPNGNIKIAHIAVIPEKRNQGIGRLLMNSIIKIVPTVKRIFLATRPTNKNAIKAYYACGFTKDHDPISEPHLNMNPNHWIYLEKELKDPIEEANEKYHEALKKLAE